MDIQDLISVVVPIHNGQRYLHENVESILNQTYENLEIIYVCDRCTDRTIDILKEYASVDIRLKVCVDNKIGGAAASRNFGMEIAQGDWIIFLDCDDLFEPDMLEAMYGSAIKGKADVCCCFWEEFYEEINQHAQIGNQAIKMYCQSYPILVVKDIKKYILQSVAHSPWTKLIHKTVYKKPTVFFQEIANCDDIYFSFVTAMEAEAIVYVDKILVHYRSNKGRITLSSDWSFMWAAYDKVYDYICQRNDSEELIQSFYNRVCACIINLVGKVQCESLNNNLRDIYFVRWGMQNSEIKKKLSYFNQEVYEKFCDRNLSMNRVSMAEQAKEHFVNDLAKKGGCSIWGCGYKGCNLLKRMECSDIEIQHLFDSNPDKWGTDIMGWTVEKYKGEWTENIIVTSSQYYEEIKRQIGDRAGHIYNLEKEIFMYY